MNRESIEDVTIAMAPIPDGCGNRRDAEREAVRRIVAELLGSDVTVEHTHEGAPYIQGGPHISITHCRDFAAVAVCAAHPVGIDAETLRPALNHVAPKFLSDTEMAKFTSLTDRLFAWTSKEAIYKIAGGLAFNFRDNIAITSYDTATSLGRDYRLHTIAVGSALLTLAVPADR